MGKSHTSVPTSKKKKGSWKKVQVFEGVTQISSKWLPQFTSIRRKKWISDEFVTNVNGQHGIGQKILFQNKLMKRQGQTKGRSMEWIMGVRSIYNYKPGIIIVKRGEALGGELSG